MRQICNSPQTRWDDPAADQQVIAKLRDWFQTLEPFTGGFYDNIEFESKDPQSGSYGPAYPRLSKIKAQYDPMNLFRLNNNIRPAAA